MTKAFGRVFPHSTALLVLLAAPRVRAAEVILSSAADTTIYEDDAAAGNGRGSHLFAGRNGVRSPRRALIRFEVSGSVPAGSTITDARLGLTMTRTRPAPAKLSLHRLTADWGEGSSHAPGEEGVGALATEGDATWTYRRWPTELWTIAGGDFAETSSAETTVGDLGSYEWTSETLAADVQSFIDDPAGNFGWVLVGDIQGPDQAKRFESRESGDAGPKLLVTFEPPPATGACCLVEGTCSISTEPNCSGTFKGLGTICGDGVCPEPTGACCAADAAATCRVEARSACSGDVWQGSGTSCEPNPCPPVLQPFVDPLPLPAVATPSDDGGRRYRIAMFQLEQTLHRDLPPTTVWGYHDGTTGGYPGPTIEAGRGKPIEVTWANELADTDGVYLEQHALKVDDCLHGAHRGPPRTVVHLHGGRVPAEYDGYPDATLLPGQAARYEYPNDQRAATLWYHDHAAGITRLNVYMGLAGFYLLRDQAEDDLGLPSGKYEIPLAIQDRTFKANGQLSYPERWQEGFFGNTALVNGKVSPYLNVDRGWYRFRLLNGSTSRTYTLHLSDGRGFLQLGNDGGLLTESIATHDVTISPGERADIAIDFRDATDTVTLLNRAAAPFPGGGGPELRDILRFVVGNERGHLAPIPLDLSNPGELDVNEVVETRDFVLQTSEEEECGARMWLINGLGWDDITERPHLGTTEIWRFVNRSGVTHPMHIHGVFFQVLDRQPFLVNGDEIVLQGELERPSRGERAWKDTVRVGPFETVRIITRFDDHEGRFPFHCHLLEHEDHGMMRQYEAVAVCGDGARARGHEECDDGNTRDGDGCDEDCAIEGRGSAAGGGGEGTGPAEGGEGGRPPVASGGEGGHDSIGGAAGALDATLSPKAPDAAGCSCRVSRSAESVAHEWLFAALALLSVSRAARRAWPSRA